jgi:16S rRNA (uracil1498-N3)-methyltransferase
MIPRLHCPQPLAAGRVIDLPAAAAHHARRVLRLGQGDPVILFDGLGGEYDGCLIGDDRVRLDRHHDIEREAPLAITLVHGLPAGDKMDWVVQKAVELGVARIQPLQTRRSVIRLSGERASRRIEHWQQIAVAACEQCGRNRVPEVAPLLELPVFLGYPAPAGEARFLLAPADADSLSAGLSALSPPSAGISLLVGPESGFEDNELIAARAAGFQPLTLGPRIMRSETAGLAALAALQGRWGDF